MKDLTRFPALAYNGQPELQYLGTAGLTLVNQLIELYNYYDNQQWLDKKTLQPITPEQLATARNLDYLPTMLVANLGAWLVDELAKFMFQKTPGINCPPEQIDTAEQMASPEYKPSERQLQANAMASAREQLLYKIAKQNRLAESLLGAGRDYHIAGGVACKLHYDPMRGLRFIWRPRLEYWPVYDADDADVLTRITFTGFPDGREDVIWKQEYWLEGYAEAKAAAAKGEAFTPPTCWMREGLYTVDLKLQKELVPAVSTDLPFIPVVIFPAKALTGETEGRSTLARVQSLLDELNAKLSDNADSLRFGMFGIKVVKNAALPSKAEIKAGKADGLVVAPNALWALSSGSMGAGGARLDPDAKVLEHQFTYKEALQYHLDAVERLVHKIANVPQIDAEKIQGLGSISGIAIRMLYDPLISATDETMTVWVPRLQRLFGYALLMLQRYDAKRHYPVELLHQAGLDGTWSATNLPFNPDDVVEVLPRLPLPQNEVEQLDQHVKKIAAMMETTKDAMNEMGEENPEAKFAEVLAEKKQIGAAMGDIFQQQGGGDAGSGSAGDGSGGQQGGRAGGGQGQ